MDSQSPCFCQRCAWLGVFTDTLDAVCPKCSRGLVQKLSKKGLDGLREERRLLAKLGYALHLTEAQRAERIEQITAFLDRLQRLKTMASAHVHCPRCCWASWGREAQAGMCPVCSGPLCVAEYDHAAIAQYVDRHKDDPSPREGLSGEGSSSPP